MCAVQKKRAARNTSNSNEDGVFTEEEGKSECEVSANETRIGSNEDAKSGMNETHGHREVVNKGWNERDTEAELVDRDG